MPSEQSYRFTTEVQLGNPELALPVEQLDPTHLSFIDSNPHTRTEVNPHNINLYFQSLSLLLAEMKDLESPISRLQLAKIVVASITGVRFRDFGIQPIDYNFLLLPDATLLDTDRDPSSADAQGQVVVATADGRSSDRSDKLDLVNQILEETTRVDADVLQRVATLYSSLDAPITIRDFTRPENMFVRSDGNISYSTLSTFNQILGTLEQLFTEFPADGTPNISSIRVVEKVVKTEVDGQLVNILVCQVIVESPGKTLGFIIPPFAIQQLG